MPVSSTALCFLEDMDAGHRHETTAAPYRSLPRQPPDPYLSAWAELRRRQRVAQLTIMGCAPLWLAGATAPHLTVAAAALPTACLFVATVLVTQLRVTRFRCPGCNHAFVWARPFRDDLRCWHCGVKFGTTASPRSA
jgi:hypothetical protein